MRRLNTLLNGLVLVGLVVAGYMILVRTQQTPPPADDPWFQANVVDQPGLVLVKFGAEWCGPCRRMEPELDQLETSLAGRGSVVRVDVTQHQDLARHYGVSSIPRLIVFDHGQVLASRVGFVDSKQLYDWVTSLEPASTPGGNQEKLPLVVENGEKLPVIVDGQGLPVVVGN